MLGISPLSKAPLSALPAISLAVVPTISGSNITILTATSVRARINVIF